MHLVNKINIWVLKESIPIVWGEIVLNFHFIDCLYDFRDSVFISLRKSNYRIHFIEHTKSYDMMRVSVFDNISKWKYISVKNKTLSKTQNIPVDKPIAVGIKANI